MNMYYAIIVVYFIVCVALGLYRANTIKTFQEYAMGASKGIGTVALIATIYATRVGAGSIFGVVERTLHDGLIFLIVGIIVIPLSCIFIQKVLCKNVERFAGCCTTVDVLEKQYGVTGRICSQIVALTFGVLIISMQFITLQSMFMLFLGIDKFYAMCLSATALCIYTIGGGIRGVILTDILQATLFLIVIPLIAFLCIKSIDFHANILDYFPAEKMLSPKYSWGAYLPFVILSAFVNELVEGPFIQRLLISGNPRQLQKTFYIAAFLDGIRYTLMLIITITIINLGNIYNKHDMLNYILHDTPIVVSILSILAILAAIMSTADSWINTTSIILTKMLYKEPTVFHGRFVCFLVCFFSLIIACNFTTLLHILKLGKCVISFTAVPLVMAFLNINVKKNDLDRMLCFGVPIFVFCGALEQYIYSEINYTFIPILFTCIISLLWGHVNINIKNICVKKRLNNSCYTYIGLLLTFILLLNWDYVTLYYNIPLAFFALIVFVCAYLLVMNKISNIIANAISIVSFLIMLCMGTKLGYVDLSIGFLLSIIFIIVLLTFVIIACLNITLEENKLMVYDALTGLYNRQYVNNIDFQTLENQSVGALYIDIDFFKKINDQYGHDIGDEILKNVSTIIKNNRRKKDIVVRYGGEEIIVLCPYIDLNGLLTIAETIRINIQENTFINNIKCSVSIGISFAEKFGGTRIDFNELIKCADTCLYKAKNTGRNKIVI